MELPTPVAVGRAEVASPGTPATRVRTRGCSVGALGARPGRKPPEPYLGPYRGGRAGPYPALQPLDLTLPPLLRTIHHMVSATSCPHHALVAVRRIRELASRRAVRVTLKAMDEMTALEPPADIDDVVEVLAGLADGDWACRIFSQVTGEAMHVFRPTTVFGPLYVKVIIRTNCIVVSFHEEVET